MKTSHILAVAMAIILMQSVRLFSLEEKLVELRAANAAAIASCRFDLPQTGDGNGASSK